MTQQLFVPRIKPAIRVLPLLLSFAFIPAAASAQAIAPPEMTATIVVHGFSSDGASRTGPFGVDIFDSTISGLAGTIGLPLGTVAPAAPNQVAACDYYGAVPPAYYTAQDLADLQAADTQYGGGVPRYALIMAKFTRQVMERSGATQVNILGVSFGGLVSRYMVEKDVGGLVSSGKVARWIVIEGVVAGHWLASQGDPDLFDLYEDVIDVSSIDIQHMNYSWVSANLHNPPTDVDNPLLSQVQTHFWLACDDEYNNRALTIASQKPNDGVVLLRDAFFHNVSTQSRHLGLRPTLGSIHATHQSSKDHTGVRAGVAAELNGRRRATIMLREVRVNNDKESSSDAPAEITFGVRVHSPQALSQYGVTSPINELRHDDTNVPLMSVAENTSTTANIMWFDGMLLPGETQLRLSTNVDEIDFDPLYGVNENILDPSQSLTDAVFFVSTVTPASYEVITADWRGIVEVTLTDYPPFAPSRVDAWELY